MKEEHYFYLWRHQYNGRTCYGISSNPEYRRSKYEGHTGEDVNFSLIIEANEPTIRALEKDLKYFIGRLGVQWKTYEWIDSSVSYETIVETVFYLLEDSRYKIIKK